MQADDSEQGQSNCVSDRHRSTAPTQHLWPKSSSSSTSEKFDNGHTGSCNTHSQNICTLHYFPISQHQKFDWLWAGDAYQPHCELHDDERCCFPRYQLIAAVDRQRSWSTYCIVRIAIVRQCDDILVTSLSIQHKCCTKPLAYFNEQHCSNIEKSDVCCNTQAEQRQVVLYTSEICLIDATYRTTCHSSACRISQTDVATV